MLKASRIAIIQHITFSNAETMEHRFSKGTFSTRVFLHTPGPLQRFNFITVHIYKRLALTWPNAGHPDYPFPAFGDEGHV